MIIHRVKFPFYGIIIVLSVLIGMGYIYINVKKEGYKNKQLFLYFIMYIAFAFVCGKIYTSLIYGKANFISAGLSAYGGLIGVVIASIIFEKILPADGKIIKYTILSLPLVYGLSKMACFIAGCCSGIPYDGFLSVKYMDVLNIWQFPIQITETIVLILVFVLCHCLRKKKNIDYITIIISSVLKFLLDFLRYDHVNIVITKNQTFSIFLLVITVITFIINNIKKSNKVNNK